MITDGWIISLELIFPASQWHSPTLTKCSIAYARSRGIATFCVHYIQSGNNFIHYFTSNPALLSLNGLVLFYVNFRIPSRHHKVAKHLHLFDPQLILH